MNLMACHLANHEKRAVVSNQYDIKEKSASQTCSLADCAQIVDDTPRISIR